MRSRGTLLPRVLLASAALVFEPSCGRVSDSSAPTATDSGGTGWAGAAGAGGLGESAGAPPVDPTAVALDTADCAARRTSECQGVKSSYSSSNELFDETPELAQCSRFNSWDGCESLQFTFDAQGCAATVAAHGDVSDPLPELRQCLTAALKDARFPCLALGTLSYQESCFIH